MDTPPPTNGGKTNGGKTNGNGHHPPKPDGMSPFTALVGALVLLALAVVGLGVMLYLGKSEKVRMQKEVARLAAEKQVNEAQAARAQAEKYRVEEQNKLEAARQQAASQRIAEQEKLAATQQQAELDRLRKQAEAQQAKAQDDARLTLARNQQAEVLQRAHNATNALVALLQQMAKVQAEAAALGTNDAGKTLARHTELVTLARRFYEADLGELPAREDVIARIENARRIEVQLNEAGGTTFQPTPEMTVSLQDQVLWADSISRKLAALQKTMAALIRESQVKFSEQPPDGASPTLQAAIRNLTLSESAARQRELVKATSEADRQAADLVKQAEVDKRILEAESKAKKIIQDAEEAAAKRKLESEQLLAQAKVEQAKGEVIKKDTEREAEKVKQRKKAQEPQVKAKLGPFLTPGHWTPGGMTYDAKPHSYSMLAGHGALDPSIEGMQKLMDIAYDPADRERPRWRFGGSVRYWRNKPSAVESVKEAQQLLIELGEVMVELKMLEP